MQRDVLSVPSFVVDLGRCARRALRRPWALLPAAVALAVAVGAATAVFAVVHSVLLRPLPYPGAERLVRLRTEVPGLGGATWGLGKAELLYFEKSSRSFASLALYSLWNATAQGSAGRCGEAEEVLTAKVSAGMLPVLGLRPVAGRPPAAADGLPTGLDTVWLSTAYWRRCFAASPAAVGATLRLNGRPVTVAGVLPAAARLPEELRRKDLRVDLWVPLELDPAAAPAASHVFRAIGRLRPGVPLAAAQTEISELTARLPEVLPTAYSREYLARTGFFSHLVPLAPDTVGDVSRPLWLLLAATGLVLLVAFANAAGLMLVRCHVRLPDAALRAALGASRARLCLPAWSEAFLVSAAAAGCGLALAAAALRALLAASPPNLPRLQEVRVDGPAAAFAVLLAAAAGLGLAALPLLVRPRDGARRSGLRPTAAARGHRTMRQALVVGQLALSLVLLVTAALLVRTLLQQVAVRPGFQSKGVLTFRVALPEDRYRPPGSVSSFYRRLMRLLAESSGVEALGAASALPLTGFDGCSSVYSPTHPLDPGEPAPCVPIFFVSPGYFESLGIAVRGVAPDWLDVERGAPLAVVSRALAGRLWPGQDPLRAEVREAPAALPYRVVGVADDVLANGLGAPPAEALYLPLVESRKASGVRPLQAAVVVRSRSADPEQLAPTIRHAVASIDPSVPVADVTPMERIVDDSLARLRFLALLLTAAAAATTLLAFTGVFSLFAYLVSVRRCEIGVRMAVGARPGRVAQEVVREALRLATMGIITGAVALPFWAKGLSAYYPFDFDGTDPVTLGLTAAVALVLLAALGSWLPARRAARVAPTEALRAGGSWKVPERCARKDRRGHLLRRKRAEPPFSTTSDADPSHELPDLPIPGVELEAIAGSRR